MSSRKRNAGLMDDLAAMIEASPFGEWEVLGIAPLSDTYPGSRMFVVRCSCGTITDHPGSNLRRGATTHCTNDEHIDIEELRRLGRIQAGLDPDTGKCDHPYCTGRHGKHAGETIPLCPAARDKQYDKDIDRQRKILREERLTKLKQTPMIGVDAEGNHFVKPRKEVA